MAKGFPTRWIALLLLLAGVFAGLRWLSTVPDPPSDSPVFTEQVVVVGVTGRTSLTEVDRQVMAARPSEMQAGAISVRTRYMGECAAAGWATLGAGRRTTVDGNCGAVEAAAGSIVGWDRYIAAAAARRGDATLGTLAASVNGCVAAVGPGAALAAARPDGTLAAYSPVDDFIAAGLVTDCPITLVDPGPRTDEVITALAADDSRTLIVAGIGPAPESADPALQVVYRVGTTLPGWVTSASTRRTGIVTLTDLTRTLVDFGAGPEAPVPTAIDGSPLTVQVDAVTPDRVAEHLAAVAALSDTIPAAYAVLGGLAAVVVAAGMVGAVRRDPRLVRLAATVGSALPAAMLLTGIVAWEYAGLTLLALSLTVAGWWAVLAAAAYGLGRWRDIPPVIAASALIVVAFTVDAALGGPLQSGSMLNSRPIDGLRWYGFGNTTFAAYATAALLWAGFLAHRRLAEDRRRLALAVVGGLGLLVVVCQGWPTMGSDFGGVVALVPPLLWLLLVLSGLRVTPVRLLVLGGAALVAVGVIAGLDWARGPDRRSHLGNFVQRVLDGDALDVVARKAVASAETVVSPLGVVAIVVGVAVWVLAIRVVVPAVGDDFSTLRPVVHAVMATGVLGTLLNDGGIYVWLTATVVLVPTLAWFWASALTPDSATRVSPPTGVSRPPRATGVANSGSRPGEAAPPTVRAPGPRPKIPPPAQKRGARKRA